jgi:hypothetical protein
MERMNIISRMVYSTRSIIFVFLRVKMFVVEPDYLPDSEVFVFIHVYTP